MRRRGVSALTYSAYVSITMLEEGRRLWCGDRKALHMARDEMAKRGIAIVYDRKNADYVVIRK